MKIGFNPNAAAHGPSARGPQTQTTTPPRETPGDGVEITLSQAAKQALKAGASEDIGSTPAYQARQYIAQSLAGASAEGANGPDLSGPFGQIVKTFAPGHNKGTAGTGDAVPEDGGDVAEVTDPADGTTVVEGNDGGDGTDATDGTGVVEGSDGGESTVVAEGPDETAGAGDPALVADEPYVTEVPDQSAPAEGEVTEPDSGAAGSGDAVASSGDDAPVDEGTPVGSGEPVAVVDTGDVTDELLDLFDEGAEETV